MITIDSLDGLHELDRGTPLTDEQRTAMKRCFDKITAFAKEHPDRVPRIPHFEHTCLDRANCRRQHDPYPPIL